MPYHKSTTTFGIPYMGAGDVMTEEQNEIQMGMIDGLLYAATSGSKSFILDEGTYSASSVLSGEDVIGYDVLITKKSDETYPLSGLISQHAFFAFTTDSYVSFRCDHVNSGTYCLVLKYNGLTLNPASCYGYEFVPSNAYSDNSDKILLCRINTSTGVVTVNSEKAYARNFVAHMDKSSNPHGSVLSQSSMNIASSVTLKGASVPGAVYGTITTGSENSVTITDGIPKFVSVQPNASVGNVYWTISGSSVNFSFDSSVTSGIELSYKIDIL